MRICTILNPNAGSAEKAAALREVAISRSDLTLRETNRPGDARALAAQALREGYDVVVAAGGDGTIHEVVNGLAPHFAQVRLGIIPMGTGNDLGRTLAIPLDPAEALQVLTLGQERQIDLIQAETASQRVYGVNVAAGGFSGQVDEVLTDELKASWGPLAYLIGATSVLRDLTHYPTIISRDDGPGERIDALNIIVANGRTVAGGFPVAPQANPEDGWLEVVIVKAVSLVQLAGVAARLLAGNYLESDHVLHYRARRLSIVSRPGMWFNVDGELFANEPITFTVQVRALRVMVGPTYTPIPADP